MKSIVSFLAISLLFVGTSCVNDDRGIEDVVPPKDALIGQWIPEKIVPVVLVLGEVAQYMQPYPHQSGCEKDYIDLQDNHLMKTAQHAADCTLTQENSSWEKDGTTITITLFNTTIEGTIVSEMGANPLIIDSDASAYQSVIEQYFPGVPIPNGTKIRLYLNKKL